MMLRLDLKTAVKTSEKLLESFKKENVFNSKTLHEIFSPKFTLDAKAIYARSKTTGNPVEIFIENKTTTDGRTTEYIYNIFDKNYTRIGKKSFKIEAHPNPRIGTHMIPGSMENTPCDIAGLGVIEDALQIETALRHGIKVIPRESASKATLFHTRMGFLPSQNLVEIKSYDDVWDILKDIMKNSPDIKLKNYKPIIIERDGKYFLDINTTQAQASVREIKERLLQEGSYRLENLEAVGTDLELSGEELNFWENLLRKHSFLDKIG